MLCEREFKLCYKNYLLEALVPCVLLVNGFRKSVSVYLQFGVIGDLQ